LCHRSEASTDVRFYFGRAISVRITLTMATKNPVVAHAVVVTPAAGTTLSQPLVVQEGEPFGDETTVITEQIVVEEPYCGPCSCFFGVVLALVFWPAALCVPCCPCDTREVPVEVTHVVRR